MTLKIDTVATSIAALSVTGVTIKDLDAIPTNVVPRDVPILFPRMDDFITNLVLTRESMGIPADAAKDVTYTLNYVYLHAPVGGTRGLHDFAQAMVQKVADIWDEFIANDDLSGPIDINPSGIASFGPLAPLEGEAFYGTHLAFEVTEHIN